jgi:hypothetical protein
VSSCAARWRTIISHRLLKVRADRRDGPDRNSSVAPGRVFFRKRRWQTQSASLLRIDEIVAGVRTNYGQPVRAECFAPCKSPHSNDKRERGRGSRRAKLIVGVQRLLRDVVPPGTGPHLETSPALASVRTSSDCGPKQTPIFLYCVKPRWNTKA